MEHSLFARLDANVAHSRRNLWQRRPASPPATPEEEALTDEAVRMGASPMAGSTVSRRIEKTAAEKRHASPGSRFRSGTTSPLFGVVTWPDVVRVLQRERAREAVLGRYRDAGFTADDFGRVRKARMTMADALTRTEDALEYSHPAPTPERLALRDVRRRLEWELFT